jgi:hypothetical protein
MVHPGTDENQARARNATTEGAQTTNSLGNHLWYDPFHSRCIMTLLTGLAGFARFGIFFKKRIKNGFMDNGSLTDPKPYFKRRLIPNLSS